MYLIRDRHGSRPAPQATPSRFDTRLRALAGIVSLVTILGVTSCDSDANGRDKNDELVGKEPPRSGGAVVLLVDFDDAPPAGAPLGPLTSAKGDASVETVTMGAGGVLSAEGIQGRAAQFPTSDDAAGGNLAVLKVSSSGADALAPGDGDFQFGLDLIYPTGAAGDSAVDDGDNLIQRGLFGDQGQYKLQVDHGRPACRIAGDRDEVIVKSKAVLETDQWYQLVCQRAAGQVTLFVAEIDQGEDEMTWSSWSSADRTGTIAPGAKPAPVSIGGKLNPQGGIVQDAPDQFSGILDNVVFRSFS